MFILDRDPAATSGHIHYFRFCAREDIESDIWNNTSDVEDFPISHCSIKSGRDIFLIAKRYMASRDVHKLIALVPAETARAMRVGLQEPQGVADRRPIGRQVLSNIERYLPRCRQRGDVSEEGARRTVPSRLVQRHLTCCPKACVLSNFEIQMAARRAV